MNATFYNNQYTTSKASTTSVETKLLNSTVDKRMGDRIVDMSMIPYMRELPIHVHADNMKPSTRVRPFFDNINVNAYIKPDDKFTVTSTNRTDFNFAPLQDPVITSR